MADDPRPDDPRRAPGQGEREGERPRHHPGDEPEFERQPDPGEQPDPRERRQL